MGPWRHAAGPPAWPGRPPDRRPKAPEPVPHRSEGRAEKRGGAGRAPPFSQPGAWWPDFSGQIGVIVAGGPSVGGIKSGLALTRAPEIAVIAVNNAWQICPWARVLYACDGSWWRHHSGCPQFTGLKVTQDRGVPKLYPDVHRVRATPGAHEILFGPKGQIGWGGNGGFHALNLAVQFGLRKIILLGFDMTLQNGMHWHGRHGGALNNPRQASVDRWRTHLDAQAKPLAAAGVDVVIGSPGSSLSQFRKLELGEAINEFRGALV